MPGRGRPRRSGCRRRSNGALFEKQAAGLAGKLRSCRDEIELDGMIWVSWPKKSSRVETDLINVVVRDTALPLGLVDVKVCAIDDIWSGLKFVIRKDQRKSKRPSGLSRGGAAR